MNMFSVLLYHCVYSRRTIENIKPCTKYLGRHGKTLRFDIHMIHACNWVGPGQRAGFLNPAPSLIQQKCRSKRCRIREGRLYCVFSSRILCHADESMGSAFMELTKEIAALKDLGRRAHPNVMSMLGVCFGCKLYWALISPSSLNRLA